MYQTKDTLIYPDWKIIWPGIAAILLVAVGVIIGYTIAECEPCECEPCLVGFATMQDMLDLQESLEECKRGQ